MRAVKCANCIVDDSVRPVRGLLGGSNLSISIICHSHWCAGISCGQRIAKASYRCHGETLDLSPID
jgi:hypothetical protein